MLATITWTSAAGGDWSVPGNWNLNRVPVASDEVVIPDLGAPGKDISIAVNSNVGSVKSITNAETLRIASGSLTNLGNLGGTGSLEINGGTLALAGADWVNASTIDLVSGTLNLGGSFTQSNYGVVNRVGGSINLQGALNGDLTLNSSSGSWNFLNGASFNSGTLKTLDGTSVTINASSGATFNNATIDGVVNTSGGFSKLQIVGNLALNGTINVGALSNELQFFGASTADHQLIAGVGSIVMYGHTGGLNSASINQVGVPHSVTIQSGITVRAAGAVNYVGGPGTWTNHGSFVADGVGKGFYVVPAGTFTNEVDGTFNASSGGYINFGGTANDLYASGEWFNRGSVIASDATLVINGANNLNNTGSITASNATVNLNRNNNQAGLGTLNRSGGTVNITGTFTGGVRLDATTGSWYLRTGTIAGGIISTDTTNRLIADGFGFSYFTGGVTIAAGSVVDMTAANNQYSRVVVTGGLTINGQLLLGGGNFSSLILNETQNVTGSGEVVLGQNGSFNTQVQGPITFTFGSGLLIRGKSGGFGGEGSGASNPTYILNGPIQVESGGVGIQVDRFVGNLVTHGTIDVASNSVFSVNAKNRWDHTGTLSSGVGSTLNLSNLVNTGTITAPGSIVNLDGAVSQTALGVLNRNAATVINLVGTLTGGLTLNAATGPWYVIGGTIDGGTIATDSVNRLIPALHPPSIFKNGVTLAAGSVLDMTGALIGGGVTVSQVQIYDGMTIDGEVWLGQSTPGGNLSSLFFENSQTINGTGTILFGNSSGASIGTHLQVPQTFTFGSALTIRGKSGRVFGEGSAASKPSFVFNGPVAVEAGGSGFLFRNDVESVVFNGGLSVALGASLAMEARNWTVGPVGEVKVNGGLLQAAAANLTNLNSGVLTAGTWEVASSGILRLPTAVTSNRAKLILDGPNSSIYQGPSGTLNALLNLSSNDATGILDLRNGHRLVPNGNLSNAGTILVDSQSALGLANAPLDSSSSYPAEGNALDSSGSNHGSLANGAGFSSGVNGQSFALNGINQYIQIADSPSLRPSSLTASLWFNFSGTTSLASLIAKPIGNSFLDSYSLWYQSGSLFAGVAVGNASNPTFIYVSTPYALDLGVWHHIAMAFDDSSKSLQLFVDGVLRNSTIATAAIAYDTRPLLIGADIENGSYAYFVPGRIDETQIFSRALSSSEVGSLYLEHALSPASFVQTGGVTKIDGTMRFEAGVTINGGLLYGSGIIRSDVTNRAGTIEPGGPLGKMSIEGSFTQSSTGVLGIQIGGTNAGINFDQLSVSGSASLGGTLNVSLSGGYGPSPGYVYPVLTSAGRLGDFSTINIPNIGGSPAFAVETLANDINLVGSSTVPDLAVTASALSSALVAAGQNLQVDFQIRNRGTVAATGNWTDRVYLSIDSRLSADDVLLGSQEHIGGLLPLSNYSGTITARVPALNDGNYRVIVVTDAGNQVADFNRSNNIVKSATPLAVRAPLLVLDTLVSGSIQLDQDIVYRLNAPPGSNIEVSASFALANQAELLISYGRVPTRSQFDLSGGDIANLNQKITLPFARGGNYYVLLHGREGASTPQSFTLRATQVPFSIANYGPTKGGNAGNVTLTLNGAGFTSDTLVTLDNGIQTFSATSVNVTNGTQLSAVFNLAGSQPGQYLLRAKRGAQSIVSTTPFELEVAPSEPPLRVSVVPSPSPIRAGGGFGFLVTIENLGPNDVVLPVFQSEGTSNVAEPKVQTKNGGILTPYDPSGASETWKTTFAINFRPKPPTAGTVSTATFGAADPESPADWSSLKNQSRPATVSVEAWDVIWANFEAAIGTTASDMQAVIDADSNYLMDIGAPVANDNAILDFEKSKANAELPLAILDAAVDVSYPQRGIPLVFSRTYVQSIAGRYNISSLGRGWVSNWDISVIEDSNGIVYVQQGSGYRRFVPLAGGIYTGLGFDDGELKFENNRFTLREASGAVTSFLPDNRLDYIEDKYGTRVSATYNGLQTILTHSDGGVMTLTRNLQNRIVQVTSPDGRTVGYSYDVSSEHLIGVSTVQGNYTYGYVSGQGAAREHALAFSSYRDGTTSNYSYDPKGRLVSISSGGSTTTFEYLTPGGYVVNDGSGSSTILVDVNSRPVSIKDAQGRVTKIGYDVNGLPTLVTAPDSTSTSRLAYDRLGNLTQSINPLGHTTQSSFDSVYRNLMAFQNQRGVSTDFQYNALGDLLATTYADGNRTTVTPGNEGLIEEATNARGAQARFSYDSRGLITEAIYPEGTTSFTYDAHANLLTATDAGGTIAMEYDTADRLKKITYPDGKFLSYVYDTLGRRTEMADQAGFMVKYAYDTEGRLKDVRDATSSLIAAYSYDTAGRLSLKENGNGTYTVYQYDTAGAVQSIFNRAPRPAPGVDGPVNSKFEYTYDVNGRVETIATIDGITTYGYDATGQLISAVLPGGRTILYAYDEAGNRTTVSDSVAGTKNYFANELDQYTSVGADQLTYDVDGNLISRTGPNGTTTYTYDSRNRLIGVVTATDTWKYQYDALGNRISITRNGQTVTQLVDPTGLGDVVGEYDASGNVVAQYYHGIGLTSRVDASRVLAYYDFDVLGSTAGLTGSSGSPVASYRYLPFGEPLSSTGTIENRFQFGGKFGISNEDNQLTFMRARFYSEGDGRFLNRDPIGIRGGSNLYTYVNNDPVNQVDLLGLSPSQDHENNSLSLLSLFGILSGSTVKNVSAISKNGLLSFLSEKFNPLITLSAEIEAAGGAAAGAVSVAGYATIAIGSIVVLTAIGSTFYAIHYQIEHEGKLPSCDPRIPGFIAGKIIACDTAQLSFDNGRRFDPVSGEWIQVGPVDPNFISGTAGFGPQQHVTPSSTLPYNIEFENKPDATAPALRVAITHQLDSDLDWSTFELGNFKFGDYEVPVPEGLQYYSVRVDATRTLNCFVDIVAELNRQTGLVTWSYTTLDPITFAVPEGDPFAGFLPPEDGLGHGQGSVSFTVQPKSNSVGGTVIDAQATIVFDTEAPIDTNVHTNRIDAEPPTSSLAPLPPLTTALSFNVTWSGSDEAGGSGIAAYDVYVSDNGGLPTLFQSNVTTTSAIFTGLLGHTYAFSTVAIDNVGHRELVATQADTQITIVDVSLSSSSIAENLAIGNLLGNLQSQFFPQNSSVTFELIGGTGSTDNSQFEIVGSAVKTKAKFDYETKASYSIRVRATNTAGQSVEKIFAIAVSDLPEVQVTTINSGAAQRSLVRDVQITFDGLVDFADLNAGDGSQRPFQVRKRGLGGGLVTTTANVSTVAGKTVVRLTFSGVFTEDLGSLVDGNYDLVINSAKISRAGTLLDGNSDGIAGGDSFFGRDALDRVVATDKFFRLLGDADGDAVVSNADLAAFNNTYRARTGDAGFNALFDFDSNGVVDNNDLRRMNTQYRKRITFN